MTTFSENNKTEEIKIKNILAEIGIPILFIMGNDDKYEWKNSKNMYNLNQKEYEYDEYRFIGYQFTNPFIGGIFEKPEYDQIVDLISLEELCTDKYILITHGPAFGK
ncbi:metallophosphoesterase family protein [Leadbettera azotonutricia]|uniref:Uncharacterized protein n=1 Tax=Leadbettera azotonutricia (strain ATCC BAA-888 / DSM 13862 / ZAS-9) TaxID=545695 RepID=F5Y7Z7_LEAAZ|nr:hypothetical protein [Leadbettera azotonutricia]AEF82821.1 hypothetical protein TREAZ_2311 [Leadbettera azotonutricia ZAS-9]